MTTFRDFPSTAILPGLALAVGLLAAVPAMAASYVPYSGTDKADKIDFRNSSKHYDIKALDGNDLVYGARTGDRIDGGKGRDTIDPWYGDDVVRGGPDGDYFRYESTFDGIWGHSGLDTICDFGKDDKLDPYVSWLDGDGGRESVSGGNFKYFDTNKDGVVDKKDKWSKVRKVSTCGTSKDALVLDVEGAFYDPENDVDSGGPASITVVGVTSLKKSQFVKDYFRDHPY